MNGKSANLNNACRQLYPDGCAIPDGEVICVMDADQVCSALQSVSMFKLCFRSASMGAWNCPVQYLKQPVC